MEARKKVFFAFSKMFADERIFPIKKDKSKLCEKNADPFMLKNVYKQLLAFHFFGFT